MEESPVHAVPDRWRYHGGKNCAERIPESRMKEYGDKFSWSSNIFSGGIRIFRRMRPAIGEFLGTCSRAPPSILNSLHSELSRKGGQVIPLEHATAKEQPSKWFRNRSRGCREPESEGKGPVEDSGLQPHSKHPGTPSQARSRPTKVQQPDGNH